jgi:4-hydroxy-tetrahydrodipicolinate reductase
MNTAASDLSVPVAVIGLGPIGRSALSFLLQRPTTHLVGACDQDPQLRGQPLSSLVAGAPEAVSVAGSIEELCRNTSPGVAVLCTSSRIPDLAPQVDLLVRNRWHVVSTCEELSYPWLRHADWSQRLDALAGQYKVAVLGCGINPGYLMDLLPALLTAPCLEVKSIRAERIVDAATRRGSLQLKVGAGLTVEEFRRRVADEKLGHVGLAESAALLSRALHWELQDLQESIEPMVAEEPQETAFVQVAKGQVTGIDHRVQARTNQGEIELVLQMYVGAQEPGDAVVIRGQPDLECRFSGGTPGDIGTIGVLLNCIPVVQSSPPGLRTMLDTPLFCRARG